MAAELVGEADLMDALAEESLIDSARAAKATSYDASRKSRSRGRTTSGGRIVLLAAEGLDLVLEEWELQRLMRVLPTELARHLRPGATARDGQVAGALASALGPDHPAHGFFAAAAREGGFRAERC